MIDIPEIIQTDEQLTAIIHITIPRAEIESVMGAAISEIMATLAAQGIKPAGSLFSYHYKRPSDIFDFEVGFPVNASITANGRVQASKLPAAKVARTIYRGGYEGLGAAWAEFFKWINTERLIAQGSLWECYKSGPETSSASANWCTELNCPLTL